MTESLVAQQSETLGAPQKSALELPILYSSSRRGQEFKLLPRWTCDYSD